MPDDKTTLAQMPTGHRATVLEIATGHGIADRLGAMGIRPGKTITKIGSMFMRGPVTIQVDRTQVAIGFGMAKKIIVQPENL
ncbi:ferrous iron transport protein A [Chloroflexota bacterium]